MIVVYFAKAGPFVKIGFSSNFRRRIATIDTANPYGISKVELIACLDRKEALNLEKTIHEKLSAFKENGEWFKLPKVDRKDINKLFPINLPEDFFSDGGISINEEHSRGKSGYTKRKSGYTTFELNERQKKQLEKAVNSLPQ